MINKYNRMRKAMLHIVTVAYHRLIVRCLTVMLHTK